jgi:hypothetical protein
VLIDVCTRPLTSRNVFPPKQPGIRRCVCGTEEVGVAVHDLANERRLISFLSSAQPSPCTASSPA